jgi:hypothetical protein
LLELLQKDIDQVYLTFRIHIKKLQLFH